ncbi:hypothetical protein [Spirosoma fluminis]
MYLIRFYLNGLALGPDIEREEMPNFQKDDLLKIGEDGERELYRVVDYTTTEQTGAVLVEVNVIEEDYVWLPLLKAKADW